MQTHHFSLAHVELTLGAARENPINHFGLSGDQVRHVQVKRGRFGDEAIGRRGDGNELVLILMFADENACTLGNAPDDFVCEKLLA